MTPDFDISSVSTPCYVVDGRLIRRNMEILDSVRKRTGCKILLAQKAFSMYRFYPLMSRYIDGTAASGLFEARLGFEEMPGREVHIFSPAYSDRDFGKILRYCSHIVFNSPMQWLRFRPLVDKACRRSGRSISCGLRVNPEYSEVETEIYNPCSPRSRLGTRAEDLHYSDIKGLEGLHFHTLCQQGSDVLERTVYRFEEAFGKYLYDMKWLNMGGGHHITRQDYDIPLLCEIIEYIQSKYSVQVYLEPGEAHALNCGYLVAQVLESRSSGGINHVIIDASAACHMPDVLEMPYRPEIIGGGLPNAKPFTCLIGAATCLAGDVIGEYSFDHPLKIGDRLVFTDMAIYTMCKNNTFNGLALPSIYYIDTDGKLKLHRSFGYEDFRSRL